MSKQRSTVMERRSFLKLGTAAAGGAAVATPFQALLARSNADQELARADGRGRARGCNPDYGPLFPTIDHTTGLPLLLLPEGFEYLTFGWTGDPLDDGSPTPAAHDGQATFRVRGGRVRIIRNHELDGSGPSFAPHLAYDAQARGGTTTLEFDTNHGELKGSWASIAGTVRNCAGGATPWGSWLTCEETLAEPAANNTYTQKHGYIFDVPVSNEATAVALKGMGRFSHEAVAVDPHTSIVYETEDAGDSGFYRFVPTQAGNLAAGKLQMLAVVDQPKYDTRIGQVQNAPLDVTWLDIDNPDPALPTEPRVFTQGFEKGGAVFARLEGAWYGLGKIYFVSTSGGKAQQGQIWEYEPSSETLSLVFESPSADVLNAPDNICVSPRGGLVLCEDGGGTEYLHGLTVDGRIFRFAQNNVVLNGERNGLQGDFRGSEFAGASYSPDGKWLFFNIQSPGITFAVKGPWRAGAL